MPDESVPVNPALRVPFGTDPVHVEAWLRAEKPGAQRLSNLVMAQPATYRPQIRRLLREAAQRIAQDDGRDLETIEERNHATHLLAEPALTTVDPVVVKDRDPEVVKLERELRFRDEQIAALLAEKEAAAAAPAPEPAPEEVVVVAHDAEAQTVTVEAPAEPEPDAAAIAASAALLDTDPDSFELPSVRRTLHADAGMED